MISIFSLDLVKKRRKRKKKRFLTSQEPSLGHRNKEKGSIPC
jgi:hypothetical protein